MLKHSIYTDCDLSFLLVVEWARLLVPVLSDVKFSWNGTTQATQELVMKNSKLDKQVRSSFHRRLPFESLV